MNRFVDERRAMHRWRAILVVFLVLTAFATLLLFVLSDHTDRLFAWTIASPLTAAFLGAGYGAGLVLVAVVIRERIWVNARVGLLSVWVFTVLTAIATFVHLDKFHFGTGPLPARFAAWLWLGVYIGVPIAMGWLLWSEHRTAPTAPTTPDRPLPGSMRVALSAHGIVLGTSGMALVLFSTRTGWWAWGLTPLTAKTVGAWLAAVGVAAGIAVVDGDLARLRPAAAAYTAFGILQLGAVARFGSEIDWSRPVGWIYVAALVTITAAGIAGLGGARRTVGTVPAPPGLA